MIGGEHLAGDQTRPRRVLELVAQDVVDAEETWPPVPPEPSVQTSSGTTVWPAGHVRPNQFAHLGEDALLDLLERTSRFAEVRRDR